MAGIDLRNTLSNPRLITKFSVTREQETVGSDGMSSITTTALGPFTGVISADRSQMERQAPFSYAPKTITVATLFALRGIAQDSSGNTFQADIVIWNGNNYFVVDIADGSNWGSGFTVATCMLKDSNSTPPTPVGAVDTTQGGG